ncbi:putative hydrolase [Fictibacillus macauensis ZFHKF-1]|uniref:Putative hydrolase n=1 Tax=Fictibacillus macauensis ZFHKF-1 TaxID=1196324 RepID=I8AM22_9BACL|nr:MBL fold metallo-hydrolase [Fictibacillus macauensis]EIT86714.1 putative hydrolase [Fictibacillus macauensis ZFHKF-1]
MTVKALASGEVTKKILHQENVFVLDVRNERDFKDWKIEGASITHHNVPYFELLDGVEDLLPILPNDQEVLVVCAKEGSSVMVADMLSEAGRDVAYLKGGMKAWSEHLEPVKIGNVTGGGELYQFVRMGKGCLSYMLLSQGEAALFDATRIIDVYIDFAQQKKATITHVFDTHLHADHISGGRAIAEKVNATYHLPPKDATDVLFNYEPLVEGQTYTIGSTTIAIQPLYSPGHTLGSTSFIIENTYLLSGDILFIDSIGRPDLAGKAEDWVGDLRETLYERYKALAPSLIVLPAHFMIMEEMNEDGSIQKPLGQLFKENHGLQVENELTFRQMVTNHLPPQPNAYQDIRETNMGKQQPDEEQQRTMEIGPNRCAVR